MQPFSTALRLHLPRKPGPAAPYSTPIPKDFSDCHVFPVIFLLTINPTSPLTLLRSRCCRNGLPTFARRSFCRGCHPRNSSQPRPACYFLVAYSLIHFPLPRLSPLRSPSVPVDPFFFTQHVVPAASFFSLLTLSSPINPRAHLQFSPAPFRSSTRACLPVPLLVFVTRTDPPLMGPLVHDHFAQ